MGKVSQIMFLYVKKKISGCANAMRQYSKQEKIILKNSLSLDTDDFRSKGWMSVEITVSSLSGRSPHPRSSAENATFQQEFNNIP